MVTFSDKTALITGASRGFGAAVAQAMAAQGAHVIAVARTVGALEELDDRIQAAGGSATLVPLDVTDDTGLQHLCLQIHERWGGLEYWVHSAIHAAPLSPAAHVDAKDLDTSIAVNVRATQRLITMVEPLLLAAPASAAVLPDDACYGEKFFAGYGAAKAAQKAMWDSWAAELINTNTRVMSFTPDPMPTALRARFYPGEDRQPLSPPAHEADKLLDLLTKR